MLFSSDMNHHRSSSLRQQCRMRVMAPMQVSPRRQLSLLRMVLALLGLLVVVAVLMLLLVLLELLLELELVVLLLLELVVLWLALLPPHLLSVILMSSVRRSHHGQVRAMKKHHWSVTETITA